MPATLLFLGTKNTFEPAKCDSTHTPRLKSMVGDAVVYVRYDQVNTIAELVMYCKAKGITGVFSTNTTLLSRLLAAMGNHKSNPSLDNYAGSYFLHSGIEFVFIHPLQQLQTVSYGSFLTRRYLSKLVNPKAWSDVPAFSFQILSASNAQEIFQEFSSAYAIATDIETLRENLQIKCIGYTGIFISSAGIVTMKSVVLPLMSCGLKPEEVLYNISLMRRMNWECKAPKIFQKGKYDLSYLSRYNAVPYAYFWDTANLFHCWYSELPKDLAFLGAFFVRKAMYWKDLAETTDLHEYFRYNALDTWTTANVWIAQLQEMPAWARDNYLQEFPLQFPCHLSEMTGLKRDMTRLEVARKEVDVEIEELNISISKMVGVYPLIFNVGSAPQNAALRKVLGCEDIKSSDEMHLKVIGNRHPLNGRITKKIATLRKKRKLASTYLTLPGDKAGAKELNGRILYTLHTDGTDTGRLASSEHSFWCGLQIQNMPRGKAVKQTLIADEGFLYAEVDLKQAETRDTAYISGDTNLIAAISGTRDFHSYNASCFFGVPYESIYDDEAQQTLDKILRDLAKRVNHGANYLMGAQVLLDTMGEDNVWMAKKKLGLPLNWGLIAVTTYLLQKFHETYPYLASIFYPGVVADVMTKRMLIGATGWTRYCFADPSKNKRDKNAYVAHVPQSLNAQVLNKAYMRVFYEIAIHPKYKDHFKLCAQIHDSILFQFRIGHEYLMEMVRQCMEIPVTVKGYDGITRTFTVPADIKAGKLGTGAKYWSDTE